LYEEHVCQGDGHAQTGRLLLRPVVGFCAAVDNLSSLDPGVGKTSAIKHLVRQTLVSPHHHDVSFLLCLPRIAEIIRLAKELGLEEADYAVLTSDEKVNGLSSTAPSDARILLTTHEMVRRHVDGRSFNEASAFHFAGGVRTVRIWDEEFLPGEVVTVTQEELATLPAHLGRSQPRLRDAVDKFVEDMKAAANGDVLDFPALSSLYTGDSVDVQNSLGPNPGQIAIDALKSCMRLSGGKVRIARSSGRQITALGVRTTMPSDFYPLLVLDASGRVRQTYELLEKGPQIVRRLRTATKDYGNLTIRVMQRGGGKYSWQKHGQELAQEIASIISSKPEEPWLVIYHKSVLGGRFPEVVSEMASGDPARISFVNWGAHQGTNDYAHIPNVILAGTTFYEEHHYLGLAHLCAAIPTDIDPMPVLVDGVKAGEHSHHILQGLCRGSARRSID
ncbi:hypothetical protein SAMN05421757_1301, partial [Tropicimonas sediminicola]